MFKTIKKLYNKIQNGLVDWLIYEPLPGEGEIMPYDFNRLKYEIRPGDVILIEGHSRVSTVIRTLTQSPWTHACLYIGRLVDFEDEETQNIIRQHINTTDGTRLLIEGVMDKGAIIAPLSTYKNHHIRICRPIGITQPDMVQVINYAIKSVGKPYNVRHLLDLTRFMLPWTILPRRWGSTLFHTSTGQPDSGICSTIIAEAFSSVQFPILPFVKPSQEGYEVFQRNPHLFAPKDFDYSPYFEITKYPLFNPEEPLPYYRRLPWTKSGLLHQDDGILSAPTERTASKLKLFRRRKKEDDAKTTTEKNDDKE